MDYKDNFQILFDYQEQTFVGNVCVSRFPGLYCFSLFFKDREVLFFVDDEQDCWMENNKGNTILADTIGEAIDTHYHPDRFLDQPPINPDDSPFFR